MFSTGNHSIELFLYTVVIDKYYEITISLAINTTALKIFKETS
jgi:hypothetical protein